MFINMLSVEKKKIYDRIRYDTKIRPLIYKDRRCLTCDILLISKYGGTRTYKYCDSCIKHGYARKDQNRRCYLNRKRLNANPI